VQGRKSSVKVEVSAQDRATLESWLRRQKTPKGLATRARGMLLLSEGVAYVQAGKEVGLTDRNLRKWARRFVAEGIAGLYDRPRPGRPPVFSPGSGGGDGPAGL
jgi:hypothetical protein